MKILLLPLLLAGLASSSVASSVTITTNTLPNGTAQTAYSAAINASGGCTPYNWAIMTGKMPPGITKKVSRSTTSWSLAGTPTTAGTYSFTVKVTSCAGQTAQKSYTVIIQDSANHIVDLSWQASTTKGVVGYNVYRGLDGISWKKINVSTVASTYYTDSTVANGTTYYYAATAVDSSGKESKKTPSIKAIVP